MKYPVGPETLKKAAKTTPGQLAILLNRVLYDKEAVVAAVVSLYRTLHDAKQRFYEISEYEQEQVRAHNESIKASNSKWEAERKAKLEQQCVD